MTAQPKPMKRPGRQMLDIAQSNADVVLMKTIGILVGSTIGGAVGAVVGIPFGFMTAFIVSTIASGFGWYYGVKIVKKFYD